MPPTTSQVLTRDECEALGRRILGMVSVSQAEVLIYSGVGTDNTFARGDVQMANEAASVYVALTAGQNGRVGQVSMTQTDDASLHALVQETERLARERRGPLSSWGLLEAQQYSAPAQLQFESTLNAMSAEARNDVCRRVLSVLSERALTGAGGLTLGLSAGSIMNTKGLFGYTCETFSQLSVSGRTEDGKASGWAWSGYADWDRVDVDAVVARAADLAQRSVNPVAVEPGRYTVILEPVALVDLMWPLIGWADQADGGTTPFSKAPKGNKIGLKMIDERLSLTTDLWDTEHPTPTLSLNDHGVAMKNTTWFDHGVLTNLAMSRTYARAHGREPIPLPEGIRLSGDGPTQTLEQMIASTKRGIWVNRIANYSEMSRYTGLSSGTTRDGTFLIENGKITKAIKNLRFTESIFFVLNRLEAFGEPVRASTYMVVPRVKVRDFDFTSLTDAV